MSNQNCHKLHIVWKLPTISIEMILNWAKGRSWVSRNLYQKQFYLFMDSKLWLLLSINEIVEFCFIIILVAGFTNFCTTGSRIKKTFVWTDVRIYPNIHPRVQTWRGMDIENFEQARLKSPVVHFICYLSVVLHVEILQRCVASRNRRQKRYNRPD